MTIRIGFNLPLQDVGGAPDTVREFAQTAEALGYDHLMLADHVLGVNVASRPDWGTRNTSADLFHDPFVLFGFLAGTTKKIGFSTQVLILPQRQTVLVAKQAASLDVLAPGRFRLGIGVGWNEVEFVGLNENFRNRGKRSEEQVQVMRALWAEPHVTFRGKYHTIDDAGINPLPPAGKIPIWFGGHHELTLQRIARWGDGWMMLAHPLETAGPEWDRLRRLTEAAGRDPGAMGLEIWTSTSGRSEADWRAEFAAWKKLGATHITLNSTFGRGVHKRLPERTVEAHMAALRRYHAAVADLA